MGSANTALRTTGVHGEKRELREGQHGKWAIQVELAVKNLPANAGDTRDSGSIPGFERSPGEGHGNPLQCSCLENPTDRGAWQAAVHGVTTSRTRLKWLGTPEQHGEHGIF